MIHILDWVFGKEAILNSCPKLTIGRYLEVHNQTKID